MATLGAQFTYNTAKSIKSQEWRFAEEINADDGADQWWQLPLQKPLSLFAIRSSRLLDVISYSLLSS
jgi:hypothetical protein